MTTAGLVLAAGEGKRFGGPKAPFLYKGERLIDRAVRTLHEAGCDPVLAVLGAWFGEVDDAEVLLNSSWSEGMGSSLRFGLQHAQHDSRIEAVVILLVDQPGITSEAIGRLMNSGGSLVQASYEGRPGHPVLIGREHWLPLIGSLHGDVGARDYLKSSPDRQLVEISDIGDDTDMDTPPN